MTQADPALAQAVRAAVREAPIHDIHTHLFAPCFGDLLLCGIDELLTYHYLVAELLRTVPDQLSPEVFYAAPKAQQADWVWEHLFERRSPLSEATRGVVTCLVRLGLDPHAGLPAHREALADLDPQTHVDRVLDLANVRTVVMTNDPFDPTERAVWSRPRDLDPRFLPVLRLDPLSNFSEPARATLAQDGFEVSATSPHDLSPADVSAIRGFLARWIETTRPLYLAASVPPEFDYPNPVWSRAILPAAAEANLPVALMIGVRRGVNPRLQLAGDGVGNADLQALARLCRDHPDQRVLCTVLSREDQHTLAVLARKFPNLHVFGCWWFVNVPSLTDEITRLRLELLGHSVTPQHSDARVLNQLIYKWDATRDMLAPILVEKYDALARLGWTVDPDQLRREVADLLGASALRFLGHTP